MPGITLDAANYKGDVKTSAEMLTGSVKTSDTIKDTQAKDSFVRSLWFQVLTIGIGAAVLALYDLVNDPKREQKVADLKQGAKDLYGTLTDFANGKVVENDNGQRTREVKMFGQTVTLMEDDGTMYAKMAGDENFTSLGKSAYDLRRHLTEDIFAHVDVFGEVVRELVVAMPDRPEDEVSLEESHTRQVCQGVIRTWSGVDASKLQNVTTANLADLAKTLVTQCHAPEAADADGHTANQIAEERIVEFDKMISADRVNSMDAQVLVDVLHADPKANEKVRMPEPQPGNAPEEAEPEVHTKGERDLVADFVLSQNVENLDKLDGLGPEVFRTHRQFVDGKMAEFRNDAELVEQKKAALKQRRINEAIDNLAERMAKKALATEVNRVIKARKADVADNGEKYASELKDLGSDIAKLESEIAQLKKEGISGLFRLAAKVKQLNDRKKRKGELEKTLAPVDRTEVEKEVFKTLLKEKKDWILSGQREWQDAEGLPEEERNAKLKVDFSAVGVQEPVYKENVFSYLQAREEALGKDETTVDQMLEDLVMEEARAEFEISDVAFNEACQKAKRNASARQFKAVVNDNRQAFVDLLLNPRAAGQSAETDLLGMALDLLRSNGQVLKMFTLTVDDAELERLKQAFGIEGDVPYAKRLANGKTIVKLSELMLEPGADAEQDASGMRELRRGFLDALEREAADAAQEQPLRIWIQKAVDEFLTGDNVEEISSTVNMLMKMVETTVNRNVAEQQNKINDQIDRTFMPNPHVGEFSYMSIDEMVEDALRPSDGGYTEFVKILLKGYFKEMPIVSKLKMVAAGIRYSKDGSSYAEVLGAMLKGAGPLLQKVLQGIDNGQLGHSALAKALQDMKSNLAPIPQEVVQAHLLDLVNRSGGKITRIDVVQSLGCASVAQTLECRVYGPGYLENGAGVAVKIIRPDALQGIRREYDFVMRCARQAKMEESYAGQIKTILEEFDFVHEAANIKAGEVYDKGYPRLKAVKLNPHIEPVPGTLVMEKAPGRDVSRYMAHSRELRTSCYLEFKNATTLEGKLAAMGKLKEHLDMVVRNQRDLCDLSAKWVKEGLYDSGLFHGDLHSANIMLDGNKGVTLIDFGNTTQLTETEQTAITRIAAAAAMPNGANGNAITVCVDNCVEGFKDLLKSEEARQKMDTTAVRNMIRTVLGKGEAEDAGKRVLVIISKLQRMGVDIPAPIFKFSQSQMRLQNTLEAFNDEVEKVASTLSDMLKLRHADKIDAQLLLVNSYNISLNSNDPLMVRPCKDLVELFVKHDGDALAQARTVYTAIMGDLLESCINKPQDERGDAFEAVLRKDNRVDKDLPMLLQFSQAHGNDLMQLMKDIVTNCRTDADARAETVAALVNVFIDAEIELVKAYHEGCHPIANAQSFADADNLKTFPQCMGRVIKQNLVATSRRLPVSLMQAIS